MPAKLKLGTMGSYTPIEDANRPWGQSETKGAEAWLKLRSSVRFPRTKWGPAKIPAKAVGDKSMGIAAKGSAPFVTGRNQPASASP